MKVEEPTIRIGPRDVDTLGDPELKAFAAFRKWYGEYLAGRRNRPLEVDGLDLRPYEESFRLVE